MLNALSIDVEEHFQVHAFENLVHRRDWDAHESRVVANTQHILALFKKHNVRGTFFVLGWVADHFPMLVQEIAQAGHEVATHGYWHELVYRQTPAEFAEDLQDSLEAICRAAPQANPIGYRAPSFSVTRESLWAHDVLREQGIKYDSSVFPLTVHDRYGINDAERFAHQLPNGLWEFPMSTVVWRKRNLPVAGGGYFRLYPLALTRRAIRRLNSEGQPAIIYLHPWEFDPKQPRIKGAPLLTRFRHYNNIGKVTSRLDQLLQEFAFGPMCEVFADYLGAEQNGTEESKIEPGATRISVE